MDSAPILFGVDPDETWSYTPKAVRGTSQKTTFLLKPPRLALAVKREELSEAIAAKARAASPGAAESVLALSGKDGKALPDLTDEQKRERVEANVRWLDAWKTAEKDHADAIKASDEAILSECVVGWSDLPGPTGKPLDFAVLGPRLLEVLRGPIRAELVAAALKGASLSREDAEGLASSPA